MLPGEAISIVIVLLVVALAGALGAIFIYRRSRDPEATTASTDTKKRKAEETFGVWLVIGTAVGVAISAAMDNLGAGIAIGIAIGIALATGQGAIK